MNPKKEFSSLIFDAVNLGKLFSLLTNIYCGPPEISGFTKNEKGETFRIKFYFTNSWYLNKNKGFSHFPFNDSEKIFSNILNNWFALMKEHPGIFGTFLYGKAQKRTAYEKVHYYVNSLEAFYDLRISDPLLPTEEFEPLKKEILSLLSKNLKKEIKEIFNTKISFLNSASLKVKLDKIFFRFSFIDQNISKFAKSFSKEIVAVRNFQSHGTLGKKIPTSRQNIIILSYLLEMYSIACLLNILGYKEDFISKFCKRLDFFHSLESSAKNSKT